MQACFCFMQFALYEMWHLLDPCWSFILYKKVFLSKLVLDDNQEYLRTCYVLDTLYITSLYSYFLSFDYSICCGFRYKGQIDVSVTSAAFIVAMALLLQRGNPRFSQLSSTMFGLFYCGYLPSFWVKLRCRLVAPALNTGKFSVPYVSIHNCRNYP